MYIGPLCVYGSWVSKFYDLSYRNLGGHLFLATQKLTNIVGSDFKDIYFHLTLHILQTGHILNDLTKFI